ncbi:hypothetical protein V2A60_009585 [Cordyceps javanica]
MKLGYWPLAFGLALPNVAAAVTSEELGHIVVFKEGVKPEHIDRHIEDVHEMHRGVGARDGKDSGHGIHRIVRLKDIDFHGYTGKFSPENLDIIKKSPHVEFVEKDTIIVLPDAESRQRPAVESQPASVEPPMDYTSFGLLSRGQGYNSFLEKGKISEAVVWPEKKKRAEANEQMAVAGNDTAQDMTAFNFTYPTTDIGDFESVDAAKYFTVPEPEELEELVQKELEELEEKRKKDGEEKKTPPELNARQSRTGNSNCAGTLQKDYKFVQDYNTYLKTLGIGGGATISGWGQSASLSGHYLNQATLNVNSLTYVVYINVEKQLTQPNGFQLNMKSYRAGKFFKVYGDRWVHSFKTGGKMVARVTFTSKEGAKITDVKAHAEAALSLWGAKGYLSADVRNSMKEASKHTNVEASLFFQGNLGAFMEKDKKSPKTISGSIEAVFEQLRWWGDIFESHACQHNHLYGPLLDEWSVVPGFADIEDSVEEIPRYDLAHIYALQILALLVKVEEQNTILQSAKDLDDSKKQEVSDAVIDMIEKSQDWVQSAAQDPKKAKRAARQLIRDFGTDFIDKYKGDVLKALVPVPAKPTAPVDCLHVGNTKYSKCMKQPQKPGETADGKEMLERCSQESKQAQQDCLAQLPK